MLKLSAATATACMLLYGVNELLLPENVFFSGYFNDILGGCLILAITNILLALAKFKPLKALLPCLGMCLACGLFWEYVTPVYLPRSVSDVWDIAAYMGGGVIWWLVYKINSRS